MTDKQQRLYMLFKEIDSICKKHSLRYYMAGGSLLGVLRHRGYIPWDDDMDILMPRDDYIKFLQICENELPAGRAVESQETDREYHNNFARYVDKTSTAIHKNQFVYNDIAGFVIDIFVLDPIPDIPEVMDRYKKDLMLYADLINCTTVYSYRFNYNSLRFILYYFKMKLLGKDRVLSGLEKRMFSYEEDDCSKYAMRWGGCCFFFDKSIFGSGKYARFFDIDVMIPDKSVEYLTWHYGDEWMFLPSHSEQEGHEAIFSIKSSYTEVQPALNSVINRKKLKKMFSHRKIINFLVMIKRNRRKEMRTGFNAILKSRNELNYLNTNRDMIYKAAETNDIMTLSGLFDSYINLQTDRSTIGREDYAGVYRYTRPILLNIPSDYSDIALEVLFCTNRISKASRLIEIIESKCNCLTEKAEQIKCDIAEFRKAVSFYASGQMISAEEICDILLQSHPKSISLLKLKIRILICRNTNRECDDQIEFFINEALKMYPQDGELFKYKADIMNNIEKKAEIYLTSVSLTANGCIHLEIADYIRKNEKAVKDFLSNIVRTGKDNAQSIIENYLLLFPDDEEALVLKNIAFEQSQKYPLSLITAERAMRSLIQQDGNSERPLLKKRYIQLLNRITGNESVSDLLFKAHEKDFQPELLISAANLFEQNNASHAWTDAIKGYIYSELGQSDKSVRHYIQSAKNAEDDFLKYYVGSYFYRDIALCAKQISGYHYLQSDGKTAEKYISENIRNIISRIESFYPDFSESLEIFKSIGLLCDKHINFLLATLHEKDRDCWNEMSLRTLNIMFKANRLESGAEPDIKGADKMYEYADRINNP